MTGDLSKLTLPPLCPEEAGVALGHFRIERAPHAHRGDHDVFSGQPVELPGLPVAVITFDLLDRPDGDRTMTEPTRVLTGTESPEAIREAARLALASAIAERHEIDWRIHVLTHLAQSTEDDG